MLPLFLDEDSMGRAIVRALQAAGIDVITAAGADRRGLSDEEQLRFAAAQGRTLYTSNVPDFTRLHAGWLRTGLHHAGIIVLTAQRTPVGAQVRALLRLATTLSPEAMADRLEFIRSELP